MTDNLILCVQGSFGGSCREWGARDWGRDREFVSLGKLMWHKSPKHELWTERFLCFSVADPFPCASSCYVKLRVSWSNSHSGPTSRYTCGLTQLIAWSASKFWTVVNVWWSNGGGRRHVAGFVMGIAWGRSLWRAGWHFGALSACARASCWCGIVWRGSAETGPDSHSAWCTRRILGGRRRSCQTAPRGPPISLAASGCRTSVRPRTSLGSEGQSTSHWVWSFRTWDPQTRLSTCPAKINRHTHEIKVTWIFLHPWAKAGAQAEWEAFHRGIYYAILNQRTLTQPPFQSSENGRPLMATGKDGAGMICTLLPIAHATSWDGAGWPRNIHSYIYIYTYHSTIAGLCT